MLNTTVAFDPAQRGLEQISSRQEESDNEAMSPPQSKLAGAKMAQRERRVGAFCLRNFPLVLREKPRSIRSSSRSSLPVR